MTPRNATDDERASGEIHRWGRIPDVVRIQSSAEWKTLAGEMRDLLTPDLL
jgi:hypothetical protein